MLACSQERSHAFIFWIELFDLVVVGVCYQDFVAEARETERMLQTNVVAASVNVAELEQIASDERLHCAAIDIDRANDVRLAIGDVEILAVVSKS